MRPTIFFFRFFLGISDDKWIVPYKFEVSSCWICLYNFSSFLLVRSIFGTYCQNLGASSYGPNRLAWPQWWSFEINGQLGLLRYNVASLSLTWLDQGRNWRVGNCPPSFWQNSNAAAGAAAWGPCAALLLAHPVLGSQLRPCWYRQNIAKKLSKPLNLP